MIRDDAEYRQVARLVARWDREIKALSYEERKPRRASNIPPFNVYWRAVESLVSYEW